VCCAWKPTMSTVVLARPRWRIGGGAASARPRTCRWRRSRSRAGPTRGDVLARLDVLHVAQVVELERRVVPSQERARLRVEALRVQLEDVGDLHGQRRVDVDTAPSGWRPSRGASSGRRSPPARARARTTARAACRRARNVRFTTLARSSSIFSMPSWLPIAVRALRDEHVRAVGDLRVAQDRPVLPAQIAREHDAPLLPVLLDVEHRDGAAEHVARVDERHLHAARDRDRRAVRHAHEALEGGPPRRRRRRAPPRARSRCRRARCGG
jgi:hypothetical protein